MTKYTVKIHVSGGALYASANINGEPQYCFKKPTDKKVTSI